MLETDVVSPDMSAPIVAVLGTGTMGAGMARNIAAAGLPVRVWNRTATRAEPLADVATVAGSIREAVEGADVVLTMLYDADSVAGAINEAGPALGDDAVWLQQSTVGVAGTERLVAQAEALGVAYVDAPVLGTRKPAEDGALVVLASVPPRSGPGWPRFSTRSAAGPCGSERRGPAPASSSPRTPGC